MKSHRTIKISLTLILLLGSLVLSGCAPEQNSTQPQITAINSLRNQLELPKKPLEFVETSFYPNSPSGNLQVAVYQDSDGRKYYVDTLTNQVVEMDARALLDTISPLASVMSEEELRAKAQRLFKATIPNFESLQANWTYDEGGKVDNYFYNWYSGVAAGSSNPARAQIALHSTGFLFGYENTLILDK
jgi:hypothetical protein